jgi:IS5 family transposase
LPAESVLRSAQATAPAQLRGVSFHLEDSASFRAFARLPLPWPPKKSVLHQTIAALRAETWEAINQALLASAKQDRRESGATVRLDSTVTSALMPEPSDSTLLSDAVRVMTRLLQRGEALPAAPAVQCRFIPFGWGDFGSSFGRPRFWGIVQPHRQEIRRRVWFVTLRASLTKALTIAEMCARQQISESWRSEAWRRPTTGSLRLRPRGFIHWPLNADAWRCQGRAFSEIVVDILCSPPAASRISLSAMFPVSTQTMPRQAGSPRSAMVAAFSIQGFHTTVDAAPFFSIPTRRRHPRSWMAHRACVSRYTRSVSAPIPDRPI